MNKLIDLLKDHQIGMWCKRAAWVILVLGIVQVAFNLYSVSRQLNSAGQPFSLTELIQLIGYGLSFLPSILFYFFILYAAAAVANHFVGIEEMDDEEVEDQDAALPL